MKVKIHKVLWYRWQNQEGLQVQFNNELITLVKDAKVAMQLVKLFFENEKPEEKIFEIKFSQDGLDVILDSIVLVG
jgi:hypothetical protein